LCCFFDVKPAIRYFWDPADVFRFIPSWEERMSGQILERRDADVRISVYATTGQKLYRLTGATTDAATVTRDFRGLLNPSFVKEAVASEQSDRSLAQCDSFLPQKRQYGQFNVRQLRPLQPARFANRVYRR
jgi:hypothetical protein